MRRQNSPPGKDVNYKSRRKRVLEIAFISSLILLSALFYSFKKFDNSSNLIIPKPFEPMTAIDVPITIQPEKIRRFTLPAIPIASEDDEFLEDIPYDLNKIDIKELIENSGPPEGDIEEGIRFHLASQKPVLIKSVQPVYPELARKAHIEGTVVTEVLIDKKGNIETAKIFKSIPMLDEAALNAVKQFKFKPGKQRDKFVKIWMHVPFSFKLK